MTRLDVPASGERHLGHGALGGLRRLDRRLDGAARPLGALLDVGGCLAGRASARALFDWKVVIGRYQDLWAELALIRAAAAETGRAGPPNPLRDNPFHLFGHYATRQLQPGTRLRAVAAPPVAAQQVSALRMCRLDGAPHPSPLTVRMLGRLRDAGPAGLTQAELLAAFPQPERRAVALGLGWLLKAGLIA